MRVHAALAQALEHVVAAHQRDLALGGLAAQQHGDFSELGARSAAPARSAMSCARSLPDDAHFALQHDAAAFPHGLLHVLDQRLDVGRASRAPVLTMKLACLGETIAPPIAKPFRPQASIRRAA